MYLKVILAILFSSGITCKKDKEDSMVQLKSPVELLTRKTWVLKSYGFDDNGNNVVDPEEELIEDCQKDNIYIFKTDGTGVYSDNALICGNGVPDNEFSWRFAEQETAIDIVHNIARIEKLNENELSFFYEIDPGNGSALRVLVKYEH
jgi:hypothetical protein